MAVSAAARRRAPRRSTCIASMATTSRTLTPSSHSITSTRCVDRSWKTFGTRTRPVARPAARAISVALRASMRKSSSSRSRSANSSISSLAWYSAAHEARASSVLADLLQHAEVAFDRVGDARGAAPSRPRLRPSRRRPRYTWPIDAAASGSQSNSVNTDSTGPPSSSTSSCSMPARSAGGTWSCSSAELVDHRRGQQVGPSRQHLAELHEHAPGILERPPHAHRHRGAPVVRLLVGDAEGLAEPVPGGDAGDLGVAAEAARALAQRVGSVAGTWSGSTGPGRACPASPASRSRPSPTWWRRSRTARGCGRSSSRPGSSSWRAAPR